jgi:RimJ/RimL family protein N-acetyltransferase
MVIFPSTQQQQALLAAHLQALAGVQPCADMKALAWADEDEDGNAVLRLVVGFTAFIGKTCQIHVAMTEGFHFTPKAMLEVVFDVAFNKLGIEKLLGVVNSKNEKAMNYDFRLGFKEEYRMPGMHDDGGDIVLLSMTREQCRYLKQDQIEVANG